MWQDSLTLPPSQQEVLSVTALNNAAKRLLEGHFGRVQVRGEISDMRHDRNSGHRYFTLKDSGATVSAAMFRSMGQRLRFVPANGQEVVASGQVTLYPRGGRYQVVVWDLMAAGAGALQAAVLALKAKLLGEGLFEPSRKRALPQLPRRVAVVTSAEGAVWRDIVQVARRRYGRPPLLLVPTRVQGQAAVTDVLAALAQIRIHAVRQQIDVVIVARGGGSLEDLAAFNDEAVARAVAALPLPIVSAIGHETDTSIVDLVADVRAPTPSAAAELVFAQRQALSDQLHTQRIRLARVLREQCQRTDMRLAHARTALGDGQRLLWPRIERHSDAARALERCARRLLQGTREQLRSLERRLAQQDPARRLERIAGRTAQAHAAAGRAMQVRLGRERQRLDAAQGRLAALSPLSVLGRGYALATTADGALLRDAQAVSAGTPIEVRLQRGALRARVEGPKPAADPA